jgi:hypothetical protein
VFLALSAQLPALAPSARVSSVAFISILKAVLVVVACDWRHVLVAVIFEIFVCFSHSQFSLRVHYLILQLQHEVHVILLFLEQ